LKGDTRGRACAQPGGATRGVRDRRRRVAGALAAVTVSLVAGMLAAPPPAPALSQRGHTFSQAIVGSGVCALSEPVAVAVDEANGDLYVANRGTGRVVELAPSGECLGQFETEVPSPQGIVVNNTPGAAGKGDVFVAGEEAVFQFSAKGKLIATKTKFKSPGGGTEELALIHGIAMDAKGELFVYRGLEGVVALSGSATVSDTGALSMSCSVDEGTTGLAVGPEGKPLYAVHFASSASGIDVGECREPFRPVVARLSAEGKPENEAIDREPSSGVVVDLSGAALGAQAKGDVYVDNETTIGELDSEGQLVQRFGAGDLTAGAGLAIDSAQGIVYVADAAKNQLAVFVPESAGPPQIDTVSFTDVSPTATVLETKIDPHGADTHYFFQYGTVDCAASPSECTDVPLPPPGQDIGMGFGHVSESVEIRGLAPATSYFYRVVAANEHGEAQASQTVHTFTTLAGAFEGLIDGRGWELVSPPEKHGASAQPIGQGQTVQAAVDGSGIAYATDAPIETEPEGSRSPERTPVLSTRTAHGWTSREIITPHEKGEGIQSGLEEYRLFSPDLTLALLEPQPPNETESEHPPLSPEASERTLYLRNNVVVPCEITQTSCYQPLVTGKEGFSNVPAETHFGGKLDTPAAAPDLHHVVFHSSVALTSSPAPGGGLYEWGAEQPLKLVSMLPDGTAPAEVALGAHTEESRSLVARSAISTNGSRVYWTAEFPEAETNVSHLYMRDTRTEKTVQIDASQGVPSPTPEEVEKFARVRYQAASADGSRVFFTDTYPLTPESTLEPIESGPADLYVCEFATPEKDECKLKDLTADAGFNENAEVVGIMLGASEDGSYVYFVADGVLAPELLAAGARPGNCGASPGAETEGGTCYLYVEHHNGSEWEPPRYIATLSQEDSPDWALGHEELDHLTARVSPHGRYLAFMSNRRLTGYDNEDAAGGTTQDEEVFVYDAREQRLTCASCNASGARPSGVYDKTRSGEGAGLLVDRVGAWQELPDEEEGRGKRLVDHHLAASIPGWTGIGAGSALYQSNYLNDEGRLFFNAADSLVLADKNHKEDVYEYEPAGVGSCRAASGCVALISSGESEREAAFLDASSSGNDAFFITSQALVAADHDTSFDVYDARVGGESHSTTPSRACEELFTCRPVSQTAVSFPTPPTAAPGTGNRAVNVGVLHAKKKALTARQKLAKALAECRHRYRNRHKRAACERAARRRYTARHSSRRASAKHSVRQPRGAVR
jgi:DNA-binding beta-propeller fold protein YncE